MVRISAIVTAFNSGKTIGFTIESILSQTLLPKELIIVNDGSTDNTLEVIEKKRKATEKKGITLIVVDQKNKGIAEATNVAIKKAKGDFILSVDSDAILKKDFIKEAMKRFSDRKVMIVAGYIGIANKKSFWARVMGYNLEYRYDQLFKEKDYVEMDHVSPCNTIYRRKLFDSIGYFDTKFHYAQDNDFSYRVKNAGYKIILLKDTGCTHFWREDFRSYMKQQFNVAYGRMKLISKYKDKAKGDKVTGLRQFVQVPLTMLVLTTFLLSFFYHRLWPMFWFIFAIYIVERFEEAGYIIKKYKDSSMCLLPFIQLLRNLAWSWALVLWIIRRK